MSKESLDITGNKYGYLTAIKYSHTGKNYMQYWVFKCDCGKEIITRKTSVISGHCKSCGCLQKEIARKEVVKHSTKHHDSKTRLYKIWKGIFARCKNKQSKYYGKKGIKVCDEWKDYEVFKCWALSNGYNDKLTIDRIDYNGNYCLENCRWATYKEQAQNTSRNKFLVISNEKKCIAEWCRQFGIKTNKYYQRIKYGLNPLTGDRI